MQTAVPESPRSKTVVDTESKFDFSELFYSRSDKRGIIRSCNSVFQRVSKYDWDKLIGKRYDVIRHPMMPQGVFHLLLEEILAGHPLASYVQNRSEDGCYYWVYALVSPIDDGFLSIGIKPSSPIFDTIRQVYAKLLEIEKTQIISSERSREILVKMIEELGFESYRHFMTEALMQEIECRQIAMNKEPIVSLSFLRSILNSGTELQNKCEAIFASHHQSRYIPLNLEVQATKIGRDAATLAVISGQYDELAKQIQAEIGKFTEAGSVVRQKVKDCQYDVCNSLLQKEMYRVFRDETDSALIQKEMEMVYLEDLTHRSIGSTEASLRQLDSEFAKFWSVYEDLHKLTVTLEIVSVLGKVEAAKINQNSGELQPLLEDLVKFKTTLRDSLKEIDAIGNSLMASTRRLKAALA